MSSQSFSSLSPKEVEICERYGGRYVWASTTEFPDGWPALCVPKIVEVSEDACHDSIPHEDAQARVACLAIPHVHSSPAAFPPLPPDELS